MIADKLLQRLDKVKQVNRNKWKACCPSHEDRSPSLFITETDDERVLIHCFGGCETVEVLDAVGLCFNDLYPVTELGESSPKIRKPFTAYDALTGIAYEGLVVLQYAKGMLSGTPFNEADRNRLLLSVTRIQRAREIV